MSTSSRRQLSVPEFPGARTIGVAAGDCTVLAAFVIYGLLFHGVDILAFPVHTAMTAVPFLLAWLVVAPLIGAYSQSTLHSVQRTLLVVGGAWIVASLIGGAIRSTPLFHGNAPLDFLLVNAAIGLLFVLPWRLVVVGSVRYWPSMLKTA